LGGSDETRLDLRSNNKYVIFHNGVNDTISTYGLKPGSEIDGLCKFYVGQTWIIINIYYDTDKSFIRLDAAKELDNLVRVMKENPTFEVELSSYTDCRQT
jgi:outer membrane protein OmpA-like peptidoglycan-associated protein